MVASALIIERVLAPNPGPLTGPGTNTFVLGDGRESIVVDPGVADEQHFAHILLAARTAGTIAGILVTHAHPDHIGGVTELQALLQVPVMAYANDATATPQATRLLQDGEAVQIGDEVVEVLYTPGHRDDHIALWYAPEGILLAGDIMAASGTVVIIPPRGDMIAYMATLHRLADLPIQAIWPGHGELITDPAQRIAMYIAHREQREQMILMVLEQYPEGVTLRPLVEQVYQDTAPSMFDWAAKSLLAHLYKLEREGRVSRPVAMEQDGPWHLR